MAITGGSATVYGVLYQILGSVERATSMFLRGLANYGDLVEATLILSQRMAATSDLVRRSSNGNRDDQEGNGPSARSSVRCFLTSSVQRMKALWRTAGYIGL